MQPQGSGGSMVWPEYNCRACGDRFPTKKPFGGRSQPQCSSCRSGAAPRPRRVHSAPAGGWPESKCTACGDRFPTKTPFGGVSAKCSSCRLVAGGGGGAVSTNGPPRATAAAVAPGAALAPAPATKAWPEYTCIACSDRFPTARPFGGPDPQCRTCQAGRPADGITAAPAGGWQETTCKNCQKVFPSKTWQEVGALCRRCYAAGPPAGGAHPPVSVSARAGSSAAAAAAGGNQPSAATAGPPLRCLSLNCQNGVASAYWYWAKPHQHIVDAMVQGTAARTARLCAALEQLLPNFDVLFLQEVDAENGMKDALQR